LNLETLEASLVRIHTIDGEVVGGGFLVEERHVLTCTHVIAQALGLTETGVDPPLVSTCWIFPCWPHAHDLRPGSSPGTL
jgi:hypothetical protein